MKHLGRIDGILRHPVKSMLGESLAETRLGIDGIPGDRAWGVRDDLRGDFLVGKRVPGLMSCRAKYPGPPGSDPVPTVVLPGGASFRADASDAGARVGAAIGRQVSLWPVDSEARRAVSSDGVVLEDEARAMMAREAGEPLPDFSNPEPALREFQARQGPFFDAYPVLLLTRRSLETLAAALPGVAVDPRRFRPTLLVDCVEPGRFPEQDWIGGRVRVGSALLSVRATCVRCAMTTFGFAEVATDPRIMRKLISEADGNLGVYATVIEPGEARRGDPVIRVD